MAPIATTGIMNMYPDPNSGQYVSPYSGETLDGTQAPVMPDYNNTYDPNTMNLANMMQDQLAGTSLNTQPLQQLQANAENPNPSPWANLESQLSRSQTQQGLGQAANQTAASTGQAEGGLALSGGLSSGATERAQEAGEQAGIGAQQSTQNQGNQALLGIGAQDAAQKQQEQMALPGMETQAYQASLEPIQMMGQANAADVANQMNATNGLNQYNMNAMDLAGSLYGANQTGTQNEYLATHTGGLFGSGGFLGTGLGQGGSNTGSWVCTASMELSPLSDGDMANLMKLIKFAAKFHRKESKWYLKNAFALVARVRTRDLKWMKRNVRFVRAVISTIESGNLERAYAFFYAHVNKLAQRYMAEERKAA